MCCTGVVPETSANTTLHKGDDCTFLVRTNGQDGLPLSVNGTVVTATTSFTAEETAAATTKDIVTVEYTTSKLPIETKSDKKILSISALANCAYTHEELRYYYTRVFGDEASVAEVKPGVYKVSWCAKEVGGMALSVLVDGQPIKGSPFVYTVVPNENDDVRTAEQGSADAAPVHDDDQDGMNDEDDVLVDASAHAGDAVDAAMGGTARTVRCTKDDHSVQAGVGLDCWELAKISSGQEIHVTGDSDSTEEGTWLKLSQSSINAHVPEEMRHLDAWVCQCTSGALGGEAFLTEADGSPIHDVIVAACSDADDSAAAKEGSVALADDIQPHPESADGVEALAPSTALPPVMLEPLVISDEMMSDVDRAVRLAPPAERSGRYTLRCAAALRAAFASYVWHVSCTRDAVNVAHALSSDASRFPATGSDFEVQRTSIHLVNLFTEPNPGVAPVAGAEVVYRSTDCGMACGRVTRSYTVGISEPVGLSAGMRLEAADRKNARVIAVATVVTISVNADTEETSVKITFDGWPSAHDYTCPLSSVDIHPIGYCQATGHTLRAPKNYGKPFLWAEYLHEKDAFPVPSYCFAHSCNRQMVSLLGVEQADCSPVPPPSLPCPLLRRNALTSTLRHEELLHLQRRPFSEAWKCAGCAFSPLRARDRELEYDGVDGHKWKVAPDEPHNGDDNRAGKKSKGVTWVRSDGTPSVERFSPAAACLYTAAASDIDLHLCERCALRVIGRELAVKTVRARTVDL